MVIHCLCVQVSRIVDHLLQCISRSDFGGLQQFWIYMNKRYFSRLSHDSLVMVHRLETGVLRMFLVHASRQARHEVIKDFFEKMSEGLHDRKEWKDWFGELRIVCERRACVRIVTSLSLMHKNFLETACKGSSGTLVWDV